MKGLAAGFLPEDMRKEKREEGIKTGMMGKHESDGASYAG